jgi:hypothetical protein
MAQAQQAMGSSPQSLASMMGQLGQQSMQPGQQFPSFLPGRGAVPPAMQQNLQAMQRPGGFQSMGGVPTPTTSTGVQTPTMRPAQLGPSPGAPGAGAGGQKNPQQKAQMGQQIAALPGGPAGAGMGQQQVAQMGQMARQQMPMGQAGGAGKPR